MKVIYIQMKQLSELFLASLGRFYLPITLVGVEVFLILGLGLNQSFKFQPALLSASQTPCYTYKHYTQEK